MENWQQGISSGEQDGAQLFSFSERITAVPAVRRIQSFCLHKLILLGVHHSRNSMAEVFEMI